ncbi:hypothetical protein BDV93DRAFT_261370 [Ceratobasidium sp. AG-I]|nr:hypothetical protein BDV93DRAFT_261370 [Ceratobasidium sp. AG-I]
MSSPRPNGPRDVVLVDLPSVNPFGDQDTRPTSRSQGGSIGRRGGAAAPTRRAHEEDEDEGAVSDGGMVMLSSHNPFPEAAPKPSHSHGGFQAPRKPAARPNTNHKDREENSENLTVLSFNPFGQDDGEDQGEDTRKDDHRRSQASHQSRPISRDHGGSIGRRGGAPRSISHVRDEEQEEEEAASDGGGVVLSSRNPFPDAIAKTGRTHTGPRSVGKSTARPPTSSKNREENPENLTVLSFNPFAQDDDGEDQEEEAREEDHRRGRASHQAPRRSQRPSATVLSDVASEEEEVPRPRKATAAKPVPRLSVRPPSPPTTRSPSVRSGASPSKHTSAAASARPRTNSRSHVNTQRPADVPGQHERDRARARTSRPKPKTTRSGSPEFDDHLLVSWEDDKRSGESPVDVRDDHHQARGSQSQRDTEYSSDASSRTYTEETFSDVESIERAPPPVTNRSSTRSSANPTHSSSKSPAVASRRAPSSVDGARARTSGRREKDGLVSYDEPAHDRRGKHRGASQPLYVVFRCESFIHLFILGTGNGAMWTCGSDQRQRTRMRRRPMTKSPLGTRDPPLARLVRASSLALPLSHRL